MYRTKPVQHRNSVCRIRTTDPRRMGKAAGGSVPYTWGTHCFRPKERGKSHLRSNLTPIQANQHYPIHQSKKLKEKSKQKSKH